MSADDNMSTNDLTVTREENLRARLDRTPMTRRAWLIIAILTIAWLVESFDIGIVGTIVVTLRDAWDLSTVEVGLVGASGTAGIVLGLVPGGRLADIHGRRTVLIWGIVVFSVFTLASALAWNLSSLVAFRFIAGLGMGAVFPLPYMLISEFVHRGRRGASLGWAELVLTAGYTLPSLVGIWAVTSLSEDLAWRIPQAIGGLPLLVIPALLIWVPESPRYLLQKGQLDKVEAFVEKLEKQAGLPHDDQLRNPHAVTDSAESSHTKRAGIRQLFGKPYLRRSAIAYSALLASFVLWYTMLTYAPTIFEMMGTSARQGLLFTALMMFIAGFGALVQGYLGDRRGRVPIQTAYIVISAVGLVVMGQTLPLGFIIAGALLAAFFGLGSFSLPKIYVTEQYPTSLRGVGSATGEMTTRFLAGVVFVYFIPTMLAVFSPAWLFVVVAALMVALVLPMALMGQETANRSVEETGSSGSNELTTTTVGR